MHLNTSRRHHRASKFPIRIFPDNCNVRGEISFNKRENRILFNIHFNFTDNGNTRLLRRLTFLCRRHKLRQQLPLIRNVEMICGYPISNSWANRVVLHRIRQTSSLEWWWLVQWMFHSAQANKQNFNNLMRLILEIREYYIPQHQTMRRLSNQCSVQQMLQAN